MRTFSGLLTVIILLIGLQGFSQSYKFGLTAGANILVQNNVSQLSGNFGTFDPEGRTGFHGGLFFENRFEYFYVRPELLFNSMKMDYPIENINPEYTLQKLSLPILVGVPLFGDKIEVFAGPAFQFVVTNTMDRSAIALEDNVPILALQAGIKVPVSPRIDISVRYDHTVGTDKTQDLSLRTNQGGEAQAVFHEGRANQIYFSVHYSIFDSTIPPKSRRGCYF